MTKELSIEAKVDHLESVLAFVDGELEQIACPMKQQMQIDIAVEELYVNIAHYAYAPETGMVTLRVETTETPASVAITFTDQGRPYNPLAKADPDVALSADERQIGGLGIFMVKKSMDEMDYEYRDGRNILTIRKHI